MNEEEAKKHQGIKKFYEDFMTDGKKTELKNQYTHFIFFPKGGYAPFYRGDEIIHVLGRIENEAFWIMNNLEIPSGSFSSFEKLVEHLKYFYKYLQNTEKLFQDVFSTFNTGNNYNDILSRVYATKTDFQAVFKVLIDISEGNVVSPENIESNSPKNEEKYDILILTAIYEEYRAVKDILVGGTDVDTPDGTRIIYYKSTLDVIYNEDKITFSVLLACANQMGLTSSAFLTTKLIHQYKPKIVTMCGIAAGIKGNIGDVMIADILWDYGSGKNELIEDKEIIQEKFTQYRFPISINQNLIGKIIRITNESDISYRVHSSGEQIDFPTKEKSLKTHIGPFVSGSAVIANDKKKEEIKKQDGKLIGFDMEGYAVAYCSHFASVDPKPLCFIIKSISDLGDKDKANENKDLHQKYAAYTSAKYLIELITHYPVLFGLLEEKK